MPLWCDVEMLPICYQHVSFSMILGHAGAYDAKGRAENGTPPVIPVDLQYPHRIGHAKGRGVSTMIPLGQIRPAHEKRRRARHDAGEKDETVSIYSIGMVC